jgi:hypothetical protein
MAQKITRVKCDGLLAHTLRVWVGTPPERRLSIIPPSTGGEVKMENTLYYGDNLDILRRYVKDETVDLVYLDPPFKSNQDYNVLFAEQNGSRAA